MFNKNMMLSVALAGALGFSASAASAGTMLGAFIKNDGWSLAELDKFNNETSKKMAVTTLFSTFDMHWNSLNIQTSNIVSRGGTPMITLMPYSDRHPDMLAAIASGADDVYINSWIESFRAWRDSYPEGERPGILLRFGHEFNGNWYPWGNNPEGLKAAWRHMHSLFEAAGVNDSVEWVWCASATDVDDYNDVTRYYPGDDVVDWTSLDGYNWGSNYAWTSWRSFDEVFSSAYVKLVENYPEKPIVIAEVGAAEPGDLPDPEWGQYGSDADATEDKEVWVADMMERIMTDYPAIRAISWFNINKELSWALNETARSGAPNSGLAAYNLMAMNDHFEEDFTPTKVADSSAVIDTDTNTGKGGGKNKDTDANGKTRGGGKNKTQSTTAEAEARSTDPTVEQERLRGIQRALAVSRMPAVVGEKLRAREAEGFRNMPDATLEKIRNSRLNLN